MLHRLHPSQRLAIDKTATSTDTVYTDTVTRGSSGSSVHCHGLVPGALSTASETRGGSGSSLDCRRLLSTDTTAAASTDTVKRGSS